MPKYHIDPSGVQTVLTNTGNESDKFQTELDPMQGYVKSAAAACGDSGAIVPALSAFFDYEGKNLTAMATRIGACVTGAAAATTAYVQGDYDMMRTYQTNASKAMISKIPKTK